MFHIGLDMVAPPPGYPRANEPPADVKAGDSDHIPGVYDPELDNMVSIFCDLCTAISESGVTAFHVTGCSPEALYYDVWMDLNCFVEELAPILTSLDNQADVLVFDFFEQGAERVYTFIRNEDHFTVRCSPSYSGVYLHPPWVEETISLRELDGQLTELLNTFVQLSQEASRVVYEHEWFQAWLREPAIHSRLRTEFRL